MAIFDVILRWAYGILRPNLKLGRRAKLQPCFVANGGPVEIADGAIVRFGTLLIPQNGYIRIGAGTSINHYCIINGYGGVEIGRRCSIAANVAIFSHNHNFRTRSKPIQSQGLNSKGVLRIGDDVWIGTGAIVLDGVSIGEGAVIGAGAVVTRNVEPYAIYVGNPARKIGERSDDSLAAE